MDTSTLISLASLIVAILALPASYFIAVRQVKVELNEYERRIKRKSRLLVANRLEEFFRVFYAAVRFQAHRDLALVLTLFHTGVRIGEAVRLQWNDVDFVNHTVRVLQEKKRKASWRVVPVPAELSAALLLYRHEGEAHTAGRHARRALGQCRIRRPFDLEARRARARLRRLMLDAGVDCSPHSLPRSSGQVG